MNLHDALTSIPSSAGCYDFIFLAKLISIAGSRVSSHILKIYGEMVPGFRRDLVLPD